MQTNDKFLSDLQELPEAGFKACAKAHGKTLEKLTDEAIEGVGDKLAGLLMEEMMNADDGTERHRKSLRRSIRVVCEDFNDSVRANHARNQFSEEIDSHRYATQCGIFTAGIPTKSWMKHRLVKPMRHCF